MKKSTLIQYHPKPLTKKKGEDNYVLTKWCLTVFFLFFNANFKGRFGHFLIVSGLVKKEKA